MTTRLFLCRHGEPEASAQGRFCARDAGLSPEGERQAAALARRVRADRVYSSPLRRARETAAALCADVVEVADLAEIEFGELEGRPYEAGAEAFRSLRFPGGESLDDLRRRVTGALDEIAQRHAHSNVAVVTHAGPIRVVLAKALGIPDDGFLAIPVEYASCTVVDWHDERLRVVRGAAAPLVYSAPVASAAILTIGNELVSGDVPNTNGSWLAKRLEPLGVKVTLIAALPDDIDVIADFVRVEAPRVDHLLITGGLGGTPDDLTREALAAAFRVEQIEQPDVADRLRARFPRAPEYAARWARLPAGSRPLENPLGGAPGFAIANVYVFPGLPSEMEAMFDSISDELRTERPIVTWRRTYRTTESRIASVLEETCERHPAVAVGSYPSFREGGSEVEVVVKSSDREALDAATAWLEPELDRAIA